MRTGSANSRVDEEALQNLTNQMSEMRVSVEALEKERDFYFGKVRLVCAVRYANQKWPCS